MVNQVKKEAATASTTSQVIDSGLSLVEIENRYLWSIQANREFDLRAFSQAIFAETLQFGKMLSLNSLRLIHLWPHKAYLLSSEITLPEALSEYASMMTDIGHGFCELSLGGRTVLEFLDNYTSVDLMNPNITRTRNLRCLLGQYQIILWWDDSCDIRILVDRSYVLSFCEYLEQLILRWSQKSI